MRICILDEAMRDRAERLAAELGCPLGGARPVADELSLVFDASGIALAYEDMSMRADFSTLVKRTTASALKHDPLVKAAKIGGAEGPLRVIDATAGLGEDSFVLAAAGFTVSMYESNPVIAALLEDALAHANGDARLAPIAQRMNLTVGDSIEAMRNCTTSPDVVLLDPMFPERRKSAAVKKKFQLLHLIEQPCADEDALLDAALCAHPRRLVIKRPPKGPWLAGRKPHYSIESKAVRFDCFSFARE